MLSRTRQIEIEVAAVDLLRDYGAASYPISIGKMLETLQVDLVPYSCLREEEKRLALLASQDKAFNVTSYDYMRAQVVLDDLQGSYFYRSRFSGGHELGHIWLEHEENAPDRELDANYFSGYLLAPHPLIIAMGGADSDEVAERFGVSGPCAAIAVSQAETRRQEGDPWRPHERWLIENARWKGGGLLGRA